MAKKKERKKLAFFAWHAFDYAADTSHLSREADYAYRRIIDEIFRTAQDSCRIPDDDEYLRAVAKATPEEWPAIRHALIDGAKPLFQKRGGFISQERLTEEIRKAQVKSGKCAGAVSERERKRIGRSSDDEQTIGERSQNDRQIKSKKNPSDSREIEEMVPSSPSLPADGVAALDVLHWGIGRVAPHLDFFDDDQAAIWLRDINPDPWWILAVLCEASASVAKARTYGYLTRILITAQSEGRAFDDPRGYVSYALSDRRLKAVTA